MIVLKVGSKGDTVLNLQKNLAKLGFAPLAVDGEFGQQTDAAVRKFQATHDLGVDGVVGSVTQAAISKAIVSQIPEPSSGETPWMDWMRSHIGESFVTGKKPTKFDEEVFAHTNYGSLDGVMQPGCAATVCAALEETGYRSTDGADAKSYLKYGKPCEPKFGAIVVFRWASGSRHVTFFDHAAGLDKIACLGGNQGHELNVSIFSKKFIEHICWPVK